MASSRWRRFAFFERNVYELPDEVYEDVIPTVSSTSSAGGGLQQTNKSSSDNKTGVASSSSSAKSSSNNNNNQTVLTPSILFHDEDQYLNDGRGYSASNSSGDHYNNSNNSPYPPISEYFSQCNVAVKLIPSANASSQTSIISHTRKNPTTVARSSTSTSTASTNKRINNNGIVSLSPVLDETGKTTFVYKDSSNININSSNQISNSLTPSKDTIWNVPVGSELVLLFIASRNSQYIHIIDLTMRCNPVGANKSAYMSTSATVTNNSSNANLSSSTARKKNSEVGIVVEKEEKQGDETNNNGNNSNTSNMVNTDSDGWRGYLYPFQYGFVSGGVKSSATFSSSALNRNRARTQQCKGRIVGMATDIQNPHPTSVSNINSNHNTNNRTQQHVHLAVITDHQDSVGITVLIDPHLHLYIPPTSTSTSSTTTNNNKKTTVDLTLHPFSPSSTIPMTIFQPSSGFDFNYRGRPRCVDIITSHNAHPPHTHFVAVGTDNGLVILYSYIFNPPKANNNSTSSENENNNSTNQDGTTAGATGGGVGGGGLNPNNKLTVLQEIPPPFVAGIGNSGVGSGGGSSTNDKNNNSVRYSVTSLRFSKKDQLFVSYKRTFPSSSNSNNSFSSSSQKQQQQSQRDNTNNQASSSLNANTMRPTGVCCYNLSKSGKSVASRFDLDGRDVRGGNAVCDLLKTTTTSSSSNNSSARTTNSSINNSDNKKKEEEESGKFVIARSDGLYLYSSKDGRNGVAPIEGSKISMCCIPSLPPSISGERDIIKNYNQFNNTSSSSTSEEEKKEDSPSTSTNSNNNNNSGLSNYVLIAAKDAKSGRDAVDIYDPNNKLVAFHVLLSPGHKALQSSAVTSKLDNSLYHPTLQYDDALVGNHHQNNLYGGRSSAIVMTSGGAIVILTERSTTEKVSLLTQKNLFKAAITLAYRDPSYPISSIVSLYRRHAEHLFRKGDYESAMNQYIYTIGSIEPSHVIYRFLDAPKIPLLAKYLEALREKELATDIHLDLLRTCYLKLNETEKAESVGMLVEQMSSSNNNNNNFGSDSSSFQRSSSSFSSLTTRGYSSILANLTHNPTESLAIICSLEGPRAAEALVIHGATLARALPRETAGIVLSLCDGTYTPNALADVAGHSTTTTNNEIDDTAGGGETKSQYLANTSKQATSLPVVGIQYPPECFSSLFLENPKLLRLILAHCNKQKCEISPSLRRTLLDLTLEEWNEARRSDDKEKERVRCNQALALLSGPHAEEIGDYEALVIVQLAGFTEGEVLLYERLQMAPMLLERYAKDGGERARRQMLAMCRTDPELIADVLGYFVSMATEKMNDGPTDKNGTEGDINVDEFDERTDDDSENSEGEAILDDIQEALDMSKAQGVLPPVRIARILAGEGVGQFSNSLHEYNEDCNVKSVPLSVALEYVAGVLDGQSKKISSLKTEIEEYNTLCDNMEVEIESLLSPNRTHTDAGDKKSILPSIDIQDLYNKLLQSKENEGKNSGNIDQHAAMGAQEEFWREMNQTEDRFETIVRFFGNIHSYKW